MNQLAKACITFRSHILSLSQNTSILQTTPRSSHSHSGFHSDVLTVLAVPPSSPTTPLPPDYYALESNESNKKLLTFQMQKNECNLITQNIYVPIVACHSDLTLTWLVLFWILSWLAFWNCVVNGELFTAALGKGFLEFGKRFLDSFNR